MLKTVFILPTGLVAAFDYEGSQLCEAQGHIVDFYYQFMKEKGLADPETEFNWTDDHGLQQALGLHLDKKWRPPAEDPE